MGTVAVLIALTTLVGGAVDAYTDWLWFVETKYTTVFSTVLSARLLLFVMFGFGAAFIIGADPSATMPQPAIEHLKRIPTIVLDPHITHTSRLARVHITTAPQGIAAPGTAYRMDEIPLPLKPALKSPYPTDEEVVRRINEAIARKPFWLPDGTQPQMLTAQV